MLNRSFIKDNARPLSVTLVGERDCKEISLEAMAAKATALEMVCFYPRGSERFTHLVHNVLSPISLAILKKKFLIFGHKLQQHCASC